MYTSESSVYRFSRVIDGKPTLFARCPKCGKDMPFETTYISGKEEDMYDFKHSGSAHCSCGCGMYCDGIVGQSLQDLLDNPIK